MICGGEMSYQDAADALSCSIGTIKSRLFRARAQMKEFLLGDDDRARGDAVHAAAPMAARVARH